MSERKEECLDSMKIRGNFEELDEELFNIILVDVPPTPSGYASTMSLSYLDRVISHIEIDDDDAVVINVGSSPSGDQEFNENIEEDDYRGNFLRMASRIEDYDGLEELVHVYDEPAAAPLDSTFLFVMGYAPDNDTYSRFFRRNPAGIDLDIAERVYSPPPSSSSYINTKLYDGPTHLSYIRPSRNWEKWYCSKKPWKNMPVCNEFLVKALNTKYHAATNIEVRIDPVKGRTLYATENIAKGHILLPQDVANAISLDEDHYTAFAQFIEDVPSAHLFQSMYHTIDGYGFENVGYGFSGYAVTTSIGTFMNHGCHEGELNASPMETLYLDEDEEETPYFSPVFLRRSEMYSMFMYASRDIKAGEELLFDYRHTYTSFKMDAAESNMCKGGNGYMRPDNKAIRVEES